MENALGFYILGKVWLHLLEEVSVPGHSEAMALIVDLKDAIIIDPETDNTLIALTQAIRAWDRRYDTIPLQLGVL